MCLIRKCVLLILQVTELPIIYAHRFGPRNSKDKEDYLRIYGSSTIDECMDLWKKCGCDGGNGIKRHRGLMGADGGSSSERGDVDDLGAVGSCSETPGQRACTGGACSDLFMSFNSQLLYFCPPPLESPPRYDV